MPTPISKVKTVPQNRVAKASIKTQSKPSVIGAAVGITDQVSLGARKIDPGMAQIDALRKMPRTPQAGVDIGKAKGNPKNPSRLNGTGPINNSALGPAKIEVSKKTYTPKETEWIKRQSDRHDAAHKNALEAENRKAVKPRNTRRAPDIDAPRPSKVRGNLKSTAGLLGKASSVFLAFQGAKKFLDGNYSEGGLEMTAGLSDLYAEASTLDKARKAKEVGAVVTSATTQATASTLSRGQVVRRVAGTAFGAAFAAVDAGHAVQSLRAGNEVAATEHALNSAWGVGALVNIPGATGAVAYSLTRLGMSQTGGDQFVSDKLESYCFSNSSAAEQQADSLNRSYSDAIGGLRGQQRVEYMRRYPKRAAGAIVGLQTALSQAKTQQEKARIQQRLHEVRRAKDQAFS